MHLISRGHEQSCELFFFKVQWGGEDPHLVHSSEWPLTARCKDLQHFKFYIAEEKALHRRSLMPRSHFGRRQLQALASNLQLCRNCGRVMLSCLKTIPLRRFQSCQQHSRTKVSKWVGGRFPGFWRWWRSRTAVSGSNCTPSLCQNAAEKGQKKRRCSAVSGALGCL